MSYILRTHMEKTRNLIFEHDMDAKRGKKDTQKHIENYNQEYDETHSKGDLFWRTRVGMWLIRYTDDSKA